MPVLHPDECLYSIVSRYKVHTNSSYSDTINDFWNLPPFTLNIGVPQSLIKVASNVPLDYITGEYLLSHCTLIPYYTFFMRENKIDLINNSALNKKIDYLESRLTIQNPDSKYIKYCPLCAAEELKQDGECYIHRTHQIENIYICERHDCKLYKYEVQPLSKDSLIYLDPSFMNFDSCYFPSQLTQLFRHCSSEAYQILNSHIKLKRDIKLCYKKKLQELDYGNVKSRYQEIMKNHEKFCFIEKDLKNENINIDELLPWIPNLFNSTNRNVKPMHHILMVYFLFNSIQNIVLKG